MSDAVHLHTHAPCGLHCLHIDGLAVRRGDHTIVHDVSLHAHCGELTVLIGRNGAGKSTIMRAIVGELPHEGRISFSGHDGAPAPRMPRCGYVPQSLALDPGSPATVRDMWYSFTSRLPVFLPRRRRTVENMMAELARFGAEDLADKQIGQLSGGERQRVLLALATSQKPDLLLLDEPVSGIDNEGLQDFYTLVDRLRSQDMLVLLISHDLRFVRTHADRVVLIENGTVAAAGKPEDVFRTAEFAAVFPEAAEGGVSG
ncbi:MAG: metal ABC transporter ATP-binding protein [Clostridia bacterium]|nr:metal ABC transporter ATP-binding protein [Clostridia bacterium]